jgi:hypothetical protein
LTLDIECQNIEGSIIKIDWGVINDDSTGACPFFTVLQIVFAVIECMKAYFTLKCFPRKKMSIECTPVRKAQSYLHQFSLNLQMPKQSCTEFHLDIKCVT